MSLNSWTTSWLMACLCTATAWSAQRSKKPACQPRIIVQGVAGAHLAPKTHGPPFAFSNVGLDVAYEHPLHTHLVVGGKASEHFLLILPGTMPDGSNYIDSLSDVQATVKGRVSLCKSCKGTALGYVGAGFGPSIGITDITNEIKGSSFSDKLWFGISADAQLGVEVFPLSWMGLLVGTGMKVWAFFRGVHHTDENPTRDYFLAWNSGIGLIFNL